MGSSAPKDGQVNEPKQQLPPAAQVEEDDEPDEWDKRIFSTGCAAENTKLTDCYFEKKDWRLCKTEVGPPYVRASSQISSLPGSPIPNRDINHPVFITTILNNHNHNHAYHNPPRAVPPPGTQLPPKPLLLWVSHPPTAAVCILVLGRPSSSTSTSDDPKTRLHKTPAHADLQPPRRHKQQVHASRQQKGQLYLQRHVRRRRRHLSPAPPIRAVLLLLQHNLAVELPLPRRRIGVRRRRPVHIPVTNKRKRRQPGSDRLVDLLPRPVDGRIRAGSGQDPHGAAEQGGRGDQARRHRVPARDQVQADPEHCLWAGWLGPGAQGGAGGRGEGCYEGVRACCAWALRSPSPRRVPVLQRGHDPDGSRGVQVQRPVAVLQGLGDSVGALGPEIPTTVQEGAVPRAVGRARREQEEEADLDEKGHGPAVPLCAGQEGWSVRGVEKGQ